MVNMEWVAVFEGWLPELQTLIPQALLEVTAGPDSRIRDDIVSIALFTDSDCGTLQPAALTGKHLLASREAYPNFSTLMAWDPDEWDLFLQKQQPGVLDPFMQRVRDFAETVPEEQWFSFTLLGFNFIVEAMKNLYREGFFEATYPGCNVAFWVTDTNLSHETQVDWVTLFNPPERYAAYVEWLRTT